MASNPFDAINYALLLTFRNPFWIKMTKSASILSSKISVNIALIENKPVFVSSDTGKIILPSGVEDQPSGSRV